MLLLLLKWTGVMRLYGQACRCSCTPLGHRWLGLGRDSEHEKPEDRCIRVTRHSEALVKKRRGRRARLLNVRISFNSASCSITPCRWRYMQDDCTTRENEVAKVSIGVEVGQVGVD